jgi:hypothetical protein
VLNLAALATMTLLPLLACGLFVVLFPFAAGRMPSDAAAFAKTKAALSRGMLHLSCCE